MVQEIEIINSVCICGVYIMSLNAKIEFLYGLNKTATRF